MTRDADADTEDVVEYVLPARRLCGTRAAVLDEIDEVIEALVGARHLLAQRPEPPTPPTRTLRIVRSALLLGLLLSSTAATMAQDAAAATTSPQSTTPADAIEWQVGAFVDLGSLQSFHAPSNHLFRSRGTTPRVNELNLNMAGAYIRKKASASSRWGVDLTGHGGEDSQMFGFSATAPNMAGSDWLRRLGPTSASYLAPIGDGLTLQGGIFSSFIGYDSLYAKDNFTYTRPWTADFTPYLMLGVNASYPVSDRFTFTGLLLNGYWHLAHANNVPSAGGQLAYKVSDLVTIKETVLYGPHQEDTSLGLWRFLSNTIVERKTDRVTTALDVHVSEERIDTPGRPRAWWVAGQLPVHWVIRGPWSVTVRPEFAWDSEGRWTTFDQRVAAMTSTLEYRASARQTQAILRLEHRYDRSTGPGGGFFTDIQPGVVGLAPGQHVLVLGAIVMFDRSFQP